jgi:hypothetical protein
MIPTVRDFVKLDVGHAGFHFMSD